MLQRKSPLDQIRWLECVNNNAGTLPAFGVARVTGANSLGILTVDQPNANGQEVVVNGPFAIPSGKRGLVTRDMPAYALYHAADGTPAVGDTWGAGSGGWDLRKNNAGFTVSGGVVSGRVMIDRIYGGSSDHKVLVDASDTTAGYLTSKLSIGDGLYSTVEHVAGNEDILIEAALGWNADSSGGVVAVNLIPGPVTLKTFTLNASGTYLFFGMVDGYFSANLAAANSTPAVLCKLNNGDFTTFVTAIGSSGINMNGKFVQSTAPVFSFLTVGIPPATISLIAQAGGLGIGDTYNSCTVNSWFLGYVKVAPF